MTEGWHWGDIGTRDGVMVTGMRDGIGTGSGGQRDGVGVMGTEGRGDRDKGTTTEGWGDGDRGMGSGDRGMGVG